MTSRPRRERRFSLPWFASTEHPVAVPFAFERPLRGLQPFDRTLARQHRREIARVRVLLLLHPVRQPVLAVGLDQRVPAVDPLAVERDDDFTALRGAVGRVVVELLGLIGAGVPDDDLAAAVFALGDLARECQVLQWVVFGVHGEMVDRWGVRQVLRDCP